MLAYMEIRLVFYWLTPNRLHQIVLNFSFIHQLDACHYI